MRFFPVRQSTKKNHLITKKKHAIHLGSHDEPEADPGEDMNNSRDNSNKDHMVQGPPVDAGEVPGKGSRTQAEQD